MKVSMVEERLHQNLHLEKDDVQVCLKVISLNYTDLFHQPHMKQGSVSIGFEFSGMVTHCGASVTHVQVQVNDHICGISLKPILQYHPNNTPHKNHHDAVLSYTNQPTHHMITIKACFVVKKAHNLTHAQACCALKPAIIAYNCFFHKFVAKHREISCGHRQIILITNLLSHETSFVLQLAHLYNIIVVGLVRDRDKTQLHTFVQHMLLKRSSLTTYAEHQRLSAYHTSPSSINITALVVL